MRTNLDFSPLFRSSIGFDRMLNTLEATRQIETIDNAPPYDIVKTSADDYRIDMAVTGRSSQRRFEVAEHVKVLGAGLGSAEGCNETDRSREAGGLSLPLAQ